MQNQKLENILNLSLNATEEEREKSQQLEVGYDTEEREWDLIVKYSGSLDDIRNVVIRVNELLNGYAIVTIQESAIEELASLPEIEYVEKPKRLYFQVLNGKRVSCIDEVQDARFSLFGRGVLIGIVDSGIDVSLNDFKDEDGNTRIMYLWDQSLEARDAERIPEGYDIGVEYTKEELMEGRYRTVDFSGHGTAVAGIAAGNGEVYKGVAPESELIIVKMRNARQDGFPRTTELMLGIDYIIRKAMMLGRPVAINISFGNTYGSHEPCN